MRIIQNKIILLNLGPANPLKFQFLVLQLLVQAYQNELFPNQVLQEATKTTEYNRIEQDLFKLVFFF